jgi:hypothetical protein
MSIEADGCSSFHSQQVHKVNAWKYTYSNIIAVDKILELTLAYI